MTPRQNRCALHLCSCAQVVSSLLCAKGGPRAIVEKAIEEKQRRLPRTCAERARRTDGDLQEEGPRGGLSALAAITTAAPTQPPSAPTIARKIAASPAFSSGIDAPINIPTIAGTIVPSAPAITFQTQNSTGCAPRRFRQRAMITEGAADSAPISEMMVKPIRISGSSEALVTATST